jgi:Family of unknown function (DUF6064)
MLPFSPEQFMAVFAAYNAAIWPAQIVAYGLGLIAVVGILNPGVHSAWVVAAALSGMWLFTGVAYHWLSFAWINPAAYGFGIAFALQACLLAYAAWSGRLRFGLPQSRKRRVAGLALVLYAAILYPMIGLIVHGYPAVPLFGVTPCPVTIFTLGCLLLTRAPISWWMIAVPVLWSLIGGTAAFLLGVPQDWALLAGGLMTISLLVLDRSVPSGTRAA